MMQNRENKIKLQINSLETRIEKMQENLNKDLEEIKKSQSIMNNAFESALMRWMKLEPIIQSEVSQKEKHQYSVLTHIYGI